MRPLKILGILLACLVLLGMLAALAVVMSVDPNAYRGDIERLARQRTGRTLHIGGKLGLKLFPYVAISIADVQLGNAAGYGPSPFLTVGEASVGVRLLPILRKRLEVTRISVDGLSANLVSRSAQDNNWKDLTRAKAGASPGGGGGVPQTSIARVDIANASLLYRDESKKSTTALSNLRLRTGALSGSEPVDVAIEFDYGNGGSKPDAHFAIAARVQLSGGSPQIALRDLNARGAWFRSASAQPVAFTVRSPAVVLDTQAQTLLPASFAAQAGDVHGTLSASAVRLFADRIVTGTLSLPRFAPREAFESLGISLPATRDPNALSTLSLSADYRLGAKQLQLTNVDLMLDATHVRGSAEVKDFDTMALGYDLRVDRIDADRYLPPHAAPRNGQLSPAQTSHAGRDSPTPLPIETLRKLDVQGMLQVEEATLDRLALTRVSLPLAAKGGRVHLGPTRANLLGGTYNGDIVVDATDAQPARRPVLLSLNEHLKSVDVGALMKATFETMRISGHGDANVVVTGAGSTDEAILHSLVGKVDFNVREGAFNGVDLSYELQRAQALLRQQPSPVHTEPARTLFNTFSGSANLEAGVLRNDDLSIETDYLKTHGRGTLDLGTKAIDYRLVASIYKLPPAGTSGARGEVEAADIPLLLTGNLGNLQIRPDLEALAAAKVRQEVNEKLQGKSDGLRKKLGDKLKDLFGH